MQEHQLELHREALLKKKKATILKLMNVSVEIKHLIDSFHKSLPYTK